MSSLGITPIDKVYRKLTLREIGSSLVLEKEEKVLVVWRGFSESTVKFVQKKRGLIRTKHEVLQAKEKEKGALVLTSQRLIWFRRRGVFGKSYHVAIEIPLEGIAGVSESGFLSKRILVSDGNAEYGFGIGSNLYEFNRFVRKALEERKKALEETRRKERIHITIDFSSLTEYMKKGGLSLTTIKCPECNAPLKMPKDGNEIICRHCNHTIYAQDIFEKIKALIG